MGIVWVRWNQIPEACVVLARFDKGSESSLGVDQAACELVLCLAFIASKRHQRWTCPGGTSISEGIS